MKCTYCRNNCIKKGKQKNGIQKFYCKACKKYQQKQYSYLAYEPNTNNRIVILIKEGCGIRSLSRILNISPTTVLKRILSISKSIQKPPITLGKTYEVDEMYTYIGNKENRICITYALERKTRSVVSFSVGRRNKGTLGMVVNTLLLSNPIQIRTDKCSIYLGLIPKELHHFKKNAESTTSKERI